MQRTVVLDVVGLTRRHLGPHTPNLARFARTGAVRTIDTILPAVTASVQATFLTGTLPSQHGAVGNGWYYRDECEVRFWKQANRLVQAPKVWELARAVDPTFTSANLCWWFNMYSSVDYAVTPRPMYPADGRKIPDAWTQPGALRHELQGELGTFPLFSFWGPRTHIKASQWIADAALRIDGHHAPSLTLVYLPHLDYCLQRVGPEGDIAKDLREVDAVAGQLIDHYQRVGARVIVLSEYGITAVSRPVHLNRVLREAGLITVRDELGRELLDAGASVAFAVADHQIAHVYVNDPARLDDVRELVAGTPGVEAVYDRETKANIGLDHPRAGELVVIADPDAWFTYYHWLDDERAPDYARTVDIHRKPGYDPVELFIDPKLRFPMGKVALTLARKKLGFRTLLDVIPLDPSLVRGSHGRADQPAEDQPILLTDQPDLLDGESRIRATDVCSLILRHLDLEEAAVRSGLATAR